MYIHVSRRCADHSGTQTALLLKIGTTSPVSQSKWEERAAAGKVGCRVEGVDESVSLFPPPPVQSDKERNPLWKVIKSKGGGERPEQSERLSENSECV